MCREFERCRLAHVAHTAASQPALLPERCHLLVADELAALGLSEAFEHCCTVFVGYDERAAAGRCDVLAHVGHLGHIGLAIIRQLLDPFRSLPRGFSS
jgi:hypothetical protein